MNVNLPAGFVVVNDRPGRCVNRVTVGQTVTFRYGGTTTGPRNVLVVKTDERGFEGPTQERDGDWRRYTYDNIVGYIYVATPFVNANTTQKRVNFNDARVALVNSLSGEQLAELYSKYVAIEGDGASYDANTGDVVVKLPEPKNTFLVQSDNESFDNLVINRKDGKVFKLYIYPSDNTVGLSNEVTDTDSGDVTPEQLRDELVKFLA